MKKKARLLSILAAVVFAAYFTPFGADSFRFAWQTHRLNAANPTADAEAAWARGDRRLMGCYGIGLTAPGVPDEEYLFYHQKNGIDPIRGTSDCFSRPFESDFNLAAHQYAAQYNRRMLLRLRGSPSSFIVSLRAAIEKAGGHAVISSGDIAYVDVPMRTLRDATLKARLASLRGPEVFRVGVEQAAPEADLWVLDAIPTITNVDLSDSAVTDGGLVAVEGRASLTVLDLSRTRITDAGLVRLRALRNLRTLYLYDTKTTEGAVAELKQAIPKLEVIR